MRPVFMVASDVAGNNATPRDAHLDKPRNERKDPIMRTSLYAIAIAALALGWSTTAHAQAEHYGNKPIEINVHAGGIAIDDGDTEILAGGRIAYNMANGFGI